MPYKIVNILHSGRKGERGTVRTDGRYPLRIGRVVDMKISELQLGKYLFLDYILDENGNDYSHNYLQCTRIIDVTMKGFGYISVETNNSIYIFEETVLT